MNLTYHVTDLQIDYEVEGRLPKICHVGANLRLTRLEEKALCRYINRLNNHLNLAVQPKFVTDATNAIYRLVLVRVLRLYYLRLANTRLPAL
jgi:hypothetical protein